VEWAKGRFGHMTVQILAPDMYKSRRPVGES